MKLKATSALALTVLLTGTTVMAETKAPEPDYTLSYNVGAVSDYRFRGIAQTSTEAAVQGGVDFAHKSGIYLGAWASNVKWVKDFNGANKGDYEVDLYGGYKNEFAGVGYDIGVISYQYPGNDSGAIGTPGAGAYSNADTSEFYGALTYKMLTFKYSQSMGDFLGNLNSNASRYFDLSANFDLGGGYTLTPHVGRQTVPNQNLTNAFVNLTGNAADYTDYSLTIAKDFGNGLALSATATGTNATEGGFYTDLKGKFIAKNAVLVGLKYSF
jgi:uncharacterized protein (TIGR02001 family)